MDAIFWNSTSNHEHDVPSRYIGPYKIKHWIKKHGYSSQVIEFVHYLTEEELYLATKKFVTDKTLMLGISTTFMTYFPHKWKDGRTMMYPEHVFNVTKRIKEEYPNLKIVLGGYASQTVYFPLADAVIMSYTGASEDIMVEYLDHLKKGSEAPPHKIIDNYYHLKSNIKVKDIPYFYDSRNKTYRIEDDDFLFEQSDVIFPGESLPLDVSRGCIFTCRFCKYPHLGKNKLDYVRGMEYIKQEMLYNYQQFGTTNYMILDDTFNDTEIKVSAFHDMVKTLPFEISYSTYIRADLLDRFPDTVHMLKDSGLWGAYHGLESLHPYASQVVGKGWSGKRARDFIPKLQHELWGDKVAVLLSFIAGLPRETEADIMNTLHWAKDNDIYSVTYNALGISDPSKNNRHVITSEFERNAGQYGFVFENDSWRNETWTKEAMNQSVKKFNTFIKDNNLRKTSIWNLGIMKMLGYDRDFLYNTSFYDLNKNEIFQRSSKAYREYYSRLMSL